MQILPLPLCGREAIPDRTSVQTLPMNDKRRNGHVEEMV